MKITQHIARTLTGRQGPSSNMPELATAVEAGFDAGLAKARRKLTAFDESVRCPGCGRADCLRPRLECGGESRLALTPADVCAERAAMYGPCGDPACTTCGPRPLVALPFEPLDAEVTREITRAAARALLAEQRRAELDSCEDFGVDPRYV